MDKDDIKSCNNCKHQMIPGYKEPCRSCIDSYLTYSNWEESKHKRLYLCDPNKNKECKKTDCGHLGTGKCFCTTNKEYMADGFLCQLKTNQDKVAEIVRTMKPEHLASYLSDDIFVCKQNCPIYDKYGYDRCPEGVTCEEAILKWLKEEA